MASGIEIRELPSVPVTAESLTVLQNPDGTGSATLASVREHVGVSIDEVTVSAEVVEAGNDPDASVEVTGTDQHKDIHFGFTLPRATKTVFTAEGEATEAGTDPAVQMTESGTPSDRKYALKFSLPKATKTRRTDDGERHAFRQEVRREIHAPAGNKDCRRFRFRNRASGRREPEGGGYGRGHGNGKGVCILLLHPAGFEGRQGGPVCREEDVPFR